MTAYPTYTAPVASVPFPTLSQQAVRVKTTFDVFAVIVLVATALGIIGFVIAAIDAHDAYLNDYSVYENYTGPFVGAAVVTAVYGAFTWAAVKLAAVFAGHIANKN